MHLPTQIPYTFPCSSKKASGPEIKTVSVPESTSNSGILPVLYFGIPNHKILHNLFPKHKNMRCSGIQEI